MCKIGETI
nr:unnamed protein product [Callosobruchus chinensis]